MSQPDECESYFGWQLLNRDHKLNNKKHDALSILVKLKKFRADMKGIVEEFYSASKNLVNFIKQCPANAKGDKQVSKIVTFYIKDSLVDITYQDTEGKTAIFYVIERGMTSIAMELLDSYYQRGYMPKNHAERYCNALICKINAEHLSEKKQVSSSSSHFISSSIENSLLQRIIKFVSSNNLKLDTSSTNQLKQWGKQNNLEKEAQHSAYKLSMN